MPGDELLLKQSHCNIQYQLMKKPENQIIVIFGGRGDLAVRKIIPALFTLFRQGLMPEKFAVVGTGRNAVTDEAYRQEVHEAATGGSNFSDKEVTAGFTSAFSYVTVNSSVPEDYSVLSESLKTVRDCLGIGDNTLFYLSVPPALYDDITNNLAARGLNKGQSGWKRVIIE